MRTNHRGQWVRVLGIGLWCILAVGCGRYLMPTPLIFQDHRVDAFHEVTPENRSTQLRIFFATDRHHTDGDSEHHGYTAKRAESLALGTCEVRVEDAKNWPTLEHQSYQPPSRRNNLSLRVTNLKEYGKLWTTLYPRELVHSLAQKSRLRLEDFFLSILGGKIDAIWDDPTQEDVVKILEPSDRFASEINQQLAQSANPDLYIYVHGYNNSFEEPIYVAAELRHYMGRPGAFIAYSWASRNDFLGYVHDRESAEYTAGHFRQLILFLAKQTKARRIHILCHSTGAVVVGTALRELRLVHHEKSLEQVRDSLRLGHVVFVAPDMDLMIFKKRNFGEQFHLLPEDISIYVSEEDRALNFARKVVYGLVRVGALRPNNLTIDEIDMMRQFAKVRLIDLAGQQGIDFFGHNHHTRNPSVSSDLILMLRHDLPPAKRGLVKPTNSPMWQFPNDYTQRVHDVAQSLYPTAAGKKISPK